MYVSVFPLLPTSIYALARGLHVEHRSRYNVDTIE